MRVIFFLLIMIFTMSCSQEDYPKQKIKSEAPKQVKVEKRLRKIDPPKIKSPFPEVNIKKNLKNIQIQQRQINIRLERIDKKLKLKKRKKCLTEKCFEGENK